MRTTWDTRLHSGGIIMSVGRIVCLVIAGCGMLASMALVAPEAKAETAHHWKVGEISCAYQISPVRDYFGYKRSQTSHCSSVQRKTASGQWTGAKILNSAVCGNTSSRWSIVDDAAVADTVAIRLLVYSGVHTGSMSSCAQARAPVGYAGTARRKGGKA